MQRRVRVLIAEDHTIVREGLKLLLSSQEELIEVCGEAKDGQEAVAMAVEMKPDVVVMDISLPVLNGIEATKLIKKNLPQTRVMALTMYANEEFVLQMIKAGASGYLIKNAASLDLVNAINLIMDRDLFYCPSIPEEVMGKYLQRVRNQEDKELTSREKQVLELIAKGYTSKEIAQKLFVSVKTVRNHRSNIMEKLNIRNVASLVRYAAQQNLIDIFSPIKTTES
jgi:two-component system response regulator NreC